MPPQQRWPLPEQPLPLPGQVVHIQHPSTEQQQQQQQQQQTTTTRPLRLVTFNIERGYELSAVIDELRAADADIVALQEVDVGCARSGAVDTGRAIAGALRMDLLFLCEFEELHSSVRDARSQGGGVHGNALLSRFGFASWHVVEHAHHPVDWGLPPERQPHPLAAREPRRGRRLTLAADVPAPWPGPPTTLRVYSCHLEVFCGALARVRQLADVFDDVRQYVAAAAAAAAAAQQSQQPQQQHQQQQHQRRYVPAVALLGDLNTMAHGVARLSPNYACDALRWRSLGLSEAAWLQRHVLSCTPPAAVNRHLLLRHGFSREEAARAVNPGLIDPFDVDADVTLDNPAYRVKPLRVGGVELLPGVSLMRGKLDWALLRGLRVARRAMGNLAWRASDHRWLLVEVEPVLRAAA